MLIDLVEKYGAEKWTFIGSFFPERSGKQCRERWYNHLSPTVKKSSWLKEEEWILFIMHMKLGNKWSKLCQYLPGRTDNTIKNHWNSTMQKKIVYMNREYNEKIKDKNESQIEKIQSEIIDKCKEVIHFDNIKFYDEKIKHYEKFKNLKLENKQSIIKLKKILHLRTHSKKNKRKGRKKNVNLEFKESEGNHSEKIQNVLLEESNKDIIKEVETKNMITPIKGTSLLHEYDMNIEKSAFNKHIIPFANELENNYTKVKTHLCFVSSIKKPVQIISDYSLLNINSNSINNSISNSISNSNSKINFIANNDLFWPNENATPNKPLDFYSNLDTFKKIPLKSVYTSNKKYDDFIINYQFINTTTPRKIAKVATPYKISTTNLDKMFFSVIQTNNDNTPLNNQP